MGIFLRLLPKLESNYGNIFTGPINTSPALADGIRYVSSETGSLYAFAISPSAQSRISFRSLAIIIAISAIASIALVSTLILKRKHKRF